MRPQYLMLPCSSSSRCFRIEYFQTQYKIDGKYEVGHAYNDKCYFIVLKQFFIYKCWAIIWSQTVKRYIFISISSHLYDLKFSHFSLPPNPSTSNKTYQKGLSNIPSTLNYIFNQIYYIYIPSDSQLLWEGQYEKHET